MLCSKALPLDILFSSNHNIHKSLWDLYFWALDPFWKIFSKIYQLKDLKPKNKGSMNFYDCHDLTKKNIYTYVRISFFFTHQWYQTSRSFGHQNLLIRSFTIWYSVKSDEHEVCDFFTYKCPGIFIRENVKLQN